MIKIIQCLFLAVSVKRLKYKEVLWKSEAISLFQYSLFQENPE
jgi:hypothetical protein